MRKCRYTKETLIKIVKESYSVRMVLNKLNVRTCGGNYKTLRNKCEEWDIDTSHFTGAAWNQGERYRKVLEPTPLDIILVKNSSYTSSTHLKYRLIREGLKEYKCEECSLITWRGKIIPLELDHINGCTRDNRLENLRILCPNCHSQTSTYRNKNKSLRI